MSLVFDQGWLAASANEPSADLRIVARKGTRTVEFCIDRDVVLARLALAPYLTAGSAADGWAEALKAACASAFARPHAEGEVIRVKEDDFRPTLKFD